MKNTYTYIDMTANEILFTETSHPKAYNKAVNEFRTDDRLNHNIKEFMNRTYDDAGNVTNEGELLWDFILTKSKNGHNQLCNRSALARQAARHEEVIKRQEEHKAKMEAIKKAKAAAIKKIEAKFNTNK